MIKAHIIFNVFMYAIVITYIICIHFAAYYNSGNKFINFFIKLFNNWIFRLIYLSIIGFFALNLFPYSDFLFAILLTIAFLCTNMLALKKDISESYEEEIVSETNLSETTQEEYIKNDPEKIRTKTELDYLKEKIADESVDFWSKNKLIKRLDEIKNKN